MLVSLLKSNSKDPKKGLPTNQNQLLLLKLVLWFLTRLLRQEQVGTIVELICLARISIYILAQNPIDVPDRALNQLELKTHHASRAFTATDKQSIKRTTKNHTTSEYCNTSAALNRLWIGEATRLRLWIKKTYSPSCKNNAYTNEQNSHFSRVGNWR
jgi:hypothetical protein